MRPARFAGAHTLHNVARMSIRHHTHAATSNCTTMPGGKRRSRTVLSAALEVAAVLECAVWILVCALAAAFARLVCAAAVAAEQVLTQQDRALRRCEADGRCHAA